MIADVPAVALDQATVVRSDALHTRVQAAIAGSVGDRALAWPEEDFDALARVLFAHQVAGCLPYAHYCRVRGVEPDTLPSWRAIPAVPTEVWKAVDLFAFPSTAATTVFQTSGTTVGTRGRHLLRRVDTYEASMAPPIDRFLRASKRPRVLVLGPDVDDAPDSSLSHMLRWTLEHRGGAGSGFLWTPAGPDLPAAERALRCRMGPVLLLGTARALQALLEEVLEDPIPQAEGSLVMETGGFKGAASSMEPEAFRSALARGLGLPREAVVSEYGMTELGSQGYQTSHARAFDPLLAEALGPVPPEAFVFPPWCRAAAVDPDTLEPLPDGRRGLLAFWDLANVDSVVGVQTADVGIVRGQAVTLFGRAEGATPRGCSLAVDEILRGPR